MNKTAIKIRYLKMKTSDKQIHRPFVRTRCDRNPQMKKRMKYQINNGESVCESDYFKHVENSLLALSKKESRLLEKRLRLSHPDNNSMIRMLSKCGVVQKYKSVQEVSLTAIAISRSQSGKQKL